MKGAIRIALIAVLCWHGLAQARRSGDTIPNSLDNAPVLWYGCAWQD